MTDYYKTSLSNRLCCTQQDRRLIYLATQFMSKSKSNTRPVLKNNKIKLNKKINHFRAEDIALGAALLCPLD